MNHTGLPGRTSSGRWVSAFRLSFVAFIALSSFGFWSRDASAEVRRYFWGSFPNVPSLKEQLKLDVDYLCQASKPDLSQYSDTAIDRFVDEFTNTDATILDNYRSFGLKELTKIRRRLIGCQNAFTEEQRKRRIRAESGLGEDRKADHTK
jgi:hypothetical protein